MKIKKIIFAFFITSCLVGSCTNNNIENSYIKFKYAGEQSEYVPQIVFYKHSITKDIIGYGSGALLTSEEFEKVKNLIQRDTQFSKIKVVNDSVNAGLYNFYIVESSSIVAFHSSKKETISNLFVNIYNQLIDSANKNSVKIELDNILKKL